MLRFLPRIPHENQFRDHMLPWGLFCKVDKRHARHVIHWLNYCAVSMEPPSHESVLILLCFVFSIACKNNMRLCFFSFKDFKEMKPAMWMM